uniref:DUF262 domain-containing protein n=1 Tax=Heterorhabditis bacteriophora TaxID=37862 RepID=A0A1I7XJV6_HETBA
MHDSQRDRLSIELLDPPQDMQEVESQEPRFISTLVETNGRYDGLIVHSPHEYETILYLNQMGVFNFVDDGSIQGCAVLKLSDGRKRSMSLWVEFITASGYLSARKIRSRFQTLVGQAVEKPQFSSMEGDAWAMNLTGAENVLLGVLIQLVSCLQCRRCAHYFLPQLDLLRGKPHHLLDQSSKLAWNLVRQLMLNARALENL